VAIGRRAGLSRLSLETPAAAEDEREPDVAGVA
jgi:hypothetical protein